MSAEIRKEREIDCEREAGVGERRLRREGMRLDSAPEVDTLPISSWLKRAIQLTFPSSIAISARDSTAQKLKMIIFKRRESKETKKKGSLTKKQGCPFLG